MTKRLANEAELQPIGCSRDGTLEHKALPETVAAFRAMTEAAERENVRLFVVWAYRSPVLQKEQFEEAETKYGRGKGIRWLAPPGYSEHQTGWTLDIGDLADAEADDNSLFERTAAFRWLKNHARLFGFEMSFPQGNWQGVGYEPWHWRFAGTESSHATFHSRGLKWVLVWCRSWFKAVECFLKAQLPSPR